MQRRAWLVAVACLVGCGGGSEAIGASETTSVAPSSSGDDVAGFDGADRTPRGNGDDGVLADTVRISETPSSLGAFESAILAEHNRVRASVRPAADPPLPPLEWSESLAALARDWAATCPDGHRPNNAAGENLYWSGGAPATPVAAVASWERESAYYDYASGACRRDGRSSWMFCGHYTQVVWRETRHLGCATRTNCPGDFENVVVCNYDPPGNVNVGATRIPHPY